MTRFLPCSLSFFLIVVSSCVLVLAGPGSPLMAQEISPEHVKFFEKEVRPLLAENCFQCHADKKQK
ncbi:MAG: hypothetical protein WCH39_26970, partial [Schlesneria sp.]